LTCSNPGNKRDLNGLIANGRSPKGVGLKGVGNEDDYCSDSGIGGVSENTLYS